MVNTSHSIKWYGFFGIIENQALYCWNSLRSQIREKKQQPVNWIRILVNMLLFIEKKKHVEVVNSKQERATNGNQ